MAFYSMAGQKVSHILVASIGNPEPYLNTLHSAGHIGLECLRQELQCPPFQLQQPFYLRTSSLTSSIGRYTLLRSPMLMNDSGRWIEHLWRSAVMYHEDHGGAPGLVLLHDMLNMKLGGLRARRWESRHRGHNGLKSIETYLPREEFPTAPLIKVAIGIGPPPSWEHEKLVRFLLRPLAKEQEDVLGRLGPLLVKKINSIEEEWRKTTSTFGTKKFYERIERWGDDKYQTGRY